MTEQATPGDTIHATYLDEDGTERQVSGTLVRTVQTEDGETYEIRTAWPISPTTAAFYKVE